MFNETGLEIPMLLPTSTDPFRCQHASESLLLSLLSSPRGPKIVNPPIPNSLKYKVPILAAEEGPAATAHRFCKFKQQESSDSPFNKRAIISGEKAPAVTAPGAPCLCICNMECVYLQHRRLCVFAPSKLRTCNIQILHLQNINYVLATCSLCLCNI